MAKRYPDQNDMAAGSSSSPSGLGSSPRQPAQDLGYQLDHLNRPALVLVGPTGTYKSSTANQLVGIENPDCDLRGRALLQARKRLVFENTPFTDVSGDSFTKQCKDYPGEKFYVVDTPGFGDVETAAGDRDHEKLREQDALTALRITKFLDGRNRRITGIVLFLHNPILTRREPRLRMVLRHLLLSFNDPQQMIDHLIIAQPFTEQADVQGKERSARRARSIVRCLIAEHLLPQLGLQCSVPEELPYACFCPFSDKKAGGSVAQTMQAFFAAVEMVNMNIALTARETSPEFLFKPEFPHGKCQRCNYDRRTTQGRVYELSSEELCCHPDIKSFAKWEKFVGGVTKILLLGIPFLVPDYVWPFFTADDFYCRQCGRSCQSQGCDPNAKHILS